MLGLFVVPNASGAIASSTIYTSTFLSGLSELYPFLGIMMALLVFGLMVWAVKEVSKGGSKKITQGGYAQFGPKKTKDYSFENKFRSNKRTEFSKHADVMGTYWHTQGARNKANKYIQDMGL